MLENSDVTSFYSHGKVVSIDVESAIAQLKQASIVTDWAGADLFIIGAAYVPNGKYRSEKVLRNLRKFWEDFFTASNAHLKEWGQPMLMLDIY
ncbi:MAG: hypothetical protein A6F71_05210 [Cycloclasticus sp. symbiont of Poecilosclerida sp. M]|nr:MAG: hypothetical protein A6F71_05210 [Cycloclasticus sp. symbiont of Poecilosclerida sp. M]